MEKQKMALMAVGFILIALASFFITKEQSAPIQSSSSTVKEKNVTQDSQDLNFSAINNQSKDATSVQLEESPEESIDTPAQSALKNYYKFITEKKFHEAYNSLTWEMQNQLGTYESFSNDYDDTISSTANNVRIISSGNTEVVLHYELIARDKFNQNRVKVQIFSGVATLKVEDNVWRIDNMRVKKDGEYVE